MKKLLIQTAAYNLWANTKLLKRLSTVPDDILSKNMGSSFPSIYDTLFHLMRADHIWWNRLQLQENIHFAQERTNEDIEELSREILRYSANWVDLIKESSEVKLEHVFGYHDSKKNYYKQPVKEVLVHVFNHFTYHRGQIVTMMRQAGVDKIPSTDFIEFTRNSKVAA